MKAPGCRKPVKFSTIASGNTFGAIFWTDGKREAPMLPDEPWLRKAPTEEVLFWSDECEEIDQINSWDGEKGQEWEELEFAEEPDEDDYIHAIESGLGDSHQKLIYLRMRLWWKGNDRIRREEAESLPEEHLENLSALEDLLSMDDANERMMRAEVCRELGKFGEAKRLLEKEFPEGYQEALKTIFRLCEARETRVARLNPGRD